MVCWTYGELDVAISSQGPLLSVAAWHDPPL
jgi:hypothetical protein